MANTAITAHIVVDFTTDDQTDPNVIAEIDSRENGFNAGKTSFFPGQDVHILLYMPSGWYCSGIYTTAGAVSLVKNNEIVDIEDFLTFIDDEVVNLNEPLYSDFTYQWIGVNLGPISVASNVCSLPPRAYDTTSGLYTPAHRVGVAKVNYKSLASVYRLSGVPVTYPKAAVMFVVTKS